MWLWWWVVSKWLMSNQNEVAFELLLVELSKVGFWQFSNIRYWIQNILAWILKFLVVNIFDIRIRQNLLTKIFFFLYSRAVKQWGILLNMQEKFTLWRMGGGGYRRFASYKSIFTFGQAARNTLYLSFVFSHVSRNKYIRYSSLVKFCFTNWKKNVKCTIQLEIVGSNNSKLSTLYLLIYYNDW